ncbi:MAG TPA: hypothetical protein VG274_05085 [Rhizomicrobium sp.]|jgi:hypothetical protein|nr:hypothetical protein [Rhizomicrobium sp.]
MARLASWFHKSNFFQVFDAALVISVEFATDAEKLNDDIPQ